MQELTLKQKNVTQPVGLVSSFQRLCNDVVEAIECKSRADQFFHLFWLAGPFILLYERTPADVWLTLIGLAFICRSILREEWAWLKFFWVRSSFAFWGVCLLSAILSDLPLYSLGEAFIWFRFPLFCMAITFWLGVDRRIVLAMFVALTLSTLIMSFILFVETAVIGQRYGRLSWPYGDLVPGNYLAKACLPAFLFLIYWTMTARPRQALSAALIAIISMIASFLTGERINLLIKVCSAALAVIFCRPKLIRLILFVATSMLTVAAVVIISPVTVPRFIGHFIGQIPIHVSSNYFQAMAPGGLAFLENPILGVGPGNLRILCPEIISGLDNYKCFNHPHNSMCSLLEKLG